MNQAQAFAAITVAAVAADRSFVGDEARLIRQQLLLLRTPYKTMPLASFGELFSGLLLRLRDSGWQALVKEAAPLLQPDQRETAFALAAQLVHCDREVSAEE